MLGISNTATQCNKPDDMNPQHQRFGNLKSRKSKEVLWSAGIKHRAVWYSLYVRCHYHFTYNVLAAARLKVHDEPAVCLLG